MGEIQNYRRLSREDFIDPPDGEWFDQLLNIVNRTFDDLVSVVQGGLTIGNMLSEVVFLKLEHGVAKEITTQIGNPVDVRVTKSDIARTQPPFWQQKSERSVEVTAKFEGPPTDPVNCRLEIIGG